MNRKWQYGKLGRGKHRVKRFPEQPTLHFILLPGSCTARSTGSTLTAPCRRTTATGSLTTPSTPSSPRPPGASTCPGPCLWTSSQQSLTRYWPIRGLHSYHWPIRGLYSNHWPIRGLHSNHWPIRVLYSNNFPIRGLHTNHWPIRGIHSNHWLITGEDRDVQEPVPPEPDDHRQGGRE